VLEEDSYRHLPKRFLHMGEIKKGAEFEPNHKKMIFLAKKEWKKVLYFN
jgi:hypothetical protein